MKLGKLLLLGVLPALALGACTPNADDNSEWNDGSQPVSFTSQIQGVKTKAANNAWDADGKDEVGIFVKQNGAFGDVLNKHYFVSADGNLTTATAEDAIYYPENGSKVDFVAYYPYSNALTGNTYSINVADQTSQSAIDLLYSVNATNKDKSVSGPVQLTFKHQLAKIVLNITKDATIPTLGGLKVSITGTKTKGSFALVNGALTPDDTSVQPIEALVSNAGSLAEAIILPANGLSGAQITFTLGGDTKTWNIPEGQNYAGGSQYTYPVTIKETGGKISVSFGDASIDDWTPVAGGNIDIDFGNGGVDPDPDPEPEPGVEVEIFKETFCKSGTPIPSGNLSISAFKDWDNVDCTFTGGGGEDIRSIIHKTDPSQSGTIPKVNNLWLKSGANGSLTIAGIKADGYKNIKILFEAAANVYNTGSSIDLNKIKVTWNGSDVVVPSRIVEQANKEANVFYEMTATTSLSGTANNTLVFSSTAIDNTVGLRVTNIRIMGTK